jgi:hypothetical protein
LCRSSRRPVQQRFRQHRLAFVPAFSAVYEPVGPIRSRVWRPFCAALFRLRRHYRKDERQLAKHRQWKPRTRNMRRLP